MIEIPHFTKYVFSEDIEEEDLSKVLKNSQIKRSIEEFENIKTENPQ